jgi:NtrC-family two-component system sensor histidine kinase KinB
MTLDLDHSRQQVNRNWTSRRRGVLVLTATLVYAVTFIPFHRVLGPQVTALSILPVVAAGWYYGLQVGLLAGLLTFPLNTLLLNLAGEPGWAVLISTGGMPTYAVAVLIGAIVGHLHNLGEQMKRELIQRQQMEEALRESEARNRALLAETERRLREQTALREAATAISSTLNLDEILAQITQQTTQIMGADGCAISSWERENGTVVALADYASPQSTPSNDDVIEADQSYSLSEYPATARVLHEHVPLIIYVDDPAADEAEKTLLKSLRWAGLLMMPMLYQEQAIGLMEVYLDDTDRYRFTDDDVTLCQALANQAVVAMENARLYEEARRRAADMIALYTIGRMASRSLVLEDVLSQALSSTLALLEFDAGLITLADPGDGRLRLAVEKGLPSILKRRHQRSQLVDTLCTYVHDQRQSLVLNDLEQETPVAIREITAQMPAIGLRACACIPLTHHDRSLGTMSLFAHHPRPFTSTERTFLDAVGHQLATAVSNAQLFQTIAGERSRLQALIESSSSGIILVGTDLRVLVTNPPALEFLHLSGQPEDWADRPLQDTLATLRHQEPVVVRSALAEMRRIQGGDESPAEGELSVPPRTINWLSLPVQMDTTTLGRLVVLRDVTEEHLLAQMREDLTHTMVHDLRNPLTAIMGSLDLLKFFGDNLSDDQHDTVKLARSSTQKMLKLINNILEVSQLESRSMPLQRAPVPLADLIAEALRVQSQLAADQDVRLEADVPPNLPPAWADARLMERVLQNLLDNAIKFSPAGGQVKVTARLDDGATPRHEAEQPDGRSYLVLSVSDSGPGISPELHGQLFQKFVTGRHERSATGLGLAFCKLAVEAHGGSIWIESTHSSQENESGQGTTFTFTLPVASPD